MPIYKLEKITADHYVAIWHIEESFDVLLATLNPSEEDGALVASFKNENKKLEWLSGRLCLKRLCEHMEIGYNGLIKNAHGKPFLKNSKAEISLTHSFPYVAAVINKHNDVGIDLEQPKEKLRKVASRFLSETELADAGDDLQSLCIYWCAKETLYKIWNTEKLSFKNNMLIDKFDLQSGGLLTGKIIVRDLVKSYTLKYQIERDYIVTYNS